ncbi:MAG: hypothetical protein EB100_02785 [Crocinitomicaceae bacterium]|nr:hypothetical protein [Crocinitomicaceae bacterium]
MATYLKNLSDYNKENIPNGADFKIGIVVSEWNDSITLNLLAGAKQTLIDNNVKEENILIRFVPGAFELPLAASRGEAGKAPTPKITVSGSYLEIYTPRPRIDGAKGFTKSARQKGFPPILSTHPIVRNPTVDSPNRHGSR